MDNEEVGNEGVDLAIATLKGLVSEGGECFPRYSKVERLAALLRREMYEAGFELEFRPVREKEGKLQLIAKQYKDDEVFEPEIGIYVYYYTEKECTARAWLEWKEHEEILKKQKELRKKQKEVEKELPNKTDDNVCRGWPLEVPVRLVQRET